MNVAQTSIEAFHWLPVAGYLQPKEAQLMAVFGLAEARLSHQQLVDAVGLPLHSICGRVNSLLTKRPVRARLAHRSTHTQTPGIDRAAGGPHGELFA